MSVEHADIAKRIQIIKNLDFYEVERFSKGRKRAIEAGNFLKTSGVNDAVIDFRQGFLGDMGNLINKINVGENGLATSASIMLEWIDPDDLRHLFLEVSAGNNDYGEKYISASFKETPHVKRKKHEHYQLEVYILLLGKEFSFTNPVANNGKKR